MKRKVIYGLSGGIILSAIGYVFGLFVGMNIGGNYFTDFTFMSGRGYEAAGYLGGLIGAFAGLLLGIWLGIKLFDKPKKDTSL